MHLYIATRGIKHSVDRLINDLQAQYMPFKYKGQDSYIQLAVRPMQMWELVFPKDQLQVVMRMLWEKERTMSKRHALALGAIRKSLGVKKVPKLDENVPRRLLCNQDVAIYPIGVKDDKDYADGTEYL